MNKKILYSTSNADKLNELRSVLKSYEILSPKDLDINIDIEETGKTFHDNAYLKAKGIYKELKKLGIEKDYYILSDDSGLIINERPDFLGLTTARDLEALSNTNPKVPVAELLLEELDSLTDRTAYIFVVTLLYTGPHSSNIVLADRLDGTISYKAVNNDSFVVDTIFIPKGQNYTLSEISSVKRKKLSPRVKNFERIMEIIKEED